MFGQTQKLGYEDFIQLAYFRGTNLIRFVILCLQLYLLVIYNNTIAHLDLNRSIVLLLFLQKQNLEITSTHSLYSFVLSGQFNFFCL